MQCIYSDRLAEGGVGGSKMHGGIRLCGCLGRSFTQPKLSCVSPELTALPVTVSNISRTVRFTTAWPPSVLYDSRIWRAAPGKRVAGARAASHVSASQGQVTPETRTAAADCILKTIMANARPSSCKLKTLHALQVTCPPVQPGQLQSILGVKSRRAVDLLLAECPDILELQTPVILSRISQLQVGPAHARYHELKQLCDSLWSLT